MKRFLVSLIGFCLLFSFSAQAQLRQNLKKHAIYKYEKSYYLNLRSNGWGFGYRPAKFVNGFEKNYWDFSFSFTRDFKQKKIPAYGSNGFGKPYFYGMINYYYVLRVMRGKQKVVTTKPYWGGVELRRYFSYGLNTGISKPIYHHIDHFDGTPTLERYDPDIHNQTVLYGRGPYSKGLSEIGLHPGVSLKAGLDFEFGTMQESIRALEVGVMLDGFILPYQILDDEKQSFFLGSLYLAVHIGKRHNK